MGKSYKAQRSFEELNSSPPWNIAEGNAFFTYFPKCILHWHIESSVIQILVKRHTLLGATLEEHLEVTADVECGDVGISWGSQGGSM